MVTKSGAAVGLILAVAAAFAATACSQPADEPTPEPTVAVKLGGIEGTVTDIDEGPVAGVRVAIASGTAAFPEIAPETDENGHYGFQGVAAGTFHVSIHGKDGKSVRLESVVVESGKTATLDFSVSFKAASHKEPTDGLCIPAAALGVSVGDSWTLEGPVRFEGMASEDALAGAGATSVTLTVFDFEDATWHLRDLSQESALVENSKIVARQIFSWLDAEGNVLDTEEQWLGGATVMAAGRGPALTLDWDCHREAWLQQAAATDLPGGGTETYSVEERTLSSGITAVVFLQTLTANQPGLELTSETAVGYDKSTGRLVLSEAHGFGTRMGTPFSSETLQEIVP